MKHDTEGDKFLVMLIQAAVYPLYPYWFRYACERVEEVSYAPVENLNLEHQGVAPSGNGVPMDVKHLLGQNGVSLVKVPAVPLVESYAPFAKGRHHMVLSGQRIAAAREFENSLVET